MNGFSGNVVTIVGRLASLPYRRAVSEVARHGGRVRRALLPETEVLVVGRKSFVQLAGGRLRAKLARADELGARCLSETAFLRALGLLAEAEPMVSAIAFDSVPVRAGLDPEIVRLLVLFDVVQPRDGGCSFRDLVAAREVGRLLADGLDLAHVLASLEQTGRRETAGDHPLTRLKLVCDERGRLSRRIDGMFAEVSGQLRLDLPGAENPSVDEVFEAAEEAEQSGELTAAAALYRRCVTLDRVDPIAPFNLANVLRELGRPGEAKLYLQLALANESSFADAWYNLALLAEAEGDGVAATDWLRRAIGHDPDYADPLYNLARLRFEAGAFAEARDLWQRYLRLDPDSEWSRRARHGLALCRREHETG
jgi:tetratricopeptide (TPR) repeat protein